MSITRYKCDELPELAEKRESELTALTAKLDWAIDYSEISRLNEDFWKKTVKGHFYRPVKIQASVRIDADVMAWLEEPGKE